MLQCAFLKGPRHLAALELEAARRLNFRRARGAMATFIAAIYQGITEMRLFVGYKAWKEEEYLLNRMTFDDLVRAYVTYPGIQIYAALILVLSLIVGVVTMTSPWMFLGMIGAWGALIPDRLVSHSPLHAAWQLDV